MPWEKHDRTKLPLTREPRVTVQKNGVMTFNVAARHALKEPHLVNLLYDAEKNRVGIQATDQADSSAYNFRQQGDSTTYNVSGQSFCRHFGISLGYTRRYPAYMEDGVLVFDLTGPEEKLS